MAKRVKHSKAHKSAKRAKRTVKRGGGCSRVRISFTTKRGKRVTFMGRPGGSTKHGGSCAGKPAATARQLAWRRIFAAAGRYCKKHGKPGTKTRGLCVRNYIREHKKAA